MRENLPTFRQLEHDRGFQTAVRLWKNEHHAEDAVEVPAWDPKEFIAIHNEANARAGDPRRGLPANRPWLVTETGARLHLPEAFNEQLGWPHPIDPPADELLRLTWILKYFVTCEQSKAYEFAKLKALAKRMATDGHRDERMMETLGRLASETNNLRLLVAETEADQMPLLPTSLRPRTADDVMVQQQIDDRRVELLSEVNALEI